jgi:hypothetical protein
VTAYTCPEGHSSIAGDYCDVCGAPINKLGARQTTFGGSLTPFPAPRSGAPATAGASKPCPSCGANNMDAALFCEACGYDFTTGQLPPPVNPLDLNAPATAAGAAAAPGAGAAPSDWMIEVWVDPEWYDHEKPSDPTDPCPAAGAPRVTPLADSGALVGRTSVSRGIHPEVDCGTDSGVSRRHAQLSLDNERWYVEDLQSTNGTFLSPAGAPLPSDPLPAGQRHEVGDNDRIFVGAWTRLVIRRATAEERGA